MTIKALIFDIGGVLQLGNPSADHPKVHKTIASKLKTGLDQYLDAIDTYYVKSYIGKISEKKALHFMARNLKTTPKKLRNLYITNYRKYYVLNKPLLQYALKKKKEGYKIAILSDQWWLSKKALVPKQFYTKFDTTIISCDVDLRKPNPAIYKLTLKKLKLPAKSTVFIDNQTWNIKPAKKLKMKTVLFKNNKQTIRDIEKLLKKR
jgi:putative hydrolase of the HAD superfamily